MRQPILVGIVDPAAAEPPGPLHRGLHRAVRARPLHHALARVGGVGAAVHRLASEAGPAGRRRTRGTYLLEEQPEGRTRVSFELAWLEAPRAERLAPPLIRAFTRRSNGRRALDAVLQKIRTSRYRSQ